MGKIVARNAQIFAKGRELSGQMNVATLGITAESPDVTCFGNTYRSRLSDTLKDVEFSLNGFYDASASQVDELFQGLIGSCTHYGFYPESASAGYVGREFQMVMGEYGIESSVTDATAISVALSGSSDVYRGESLGYSLIEGVSACYLSASNGASTVQALGLFRVLEFEGTDISACFQHSDDDVTFATLLDFGTFTTPNNVAASLMSSASSFRRVRVLMTGAGASATVQAFSGSTS